jgi:hypothetical protein
MTGCATRSTLVKKIDPGEEDSYGSSWRRNWDGRRYHAREHLPAMGQPSPATTDGPAQVAGPSDERGPR